MSTKHWNKWRATDSVRNLSNWEAICSNITLLLWFKYVLCSVKHLKEKKKNIWGFSHSSGVNLLMFLMSPSQDKKNKQTLPYFLSRGQSRAADSPSTDMRLLWLVKSISVRSWYCRVWSSSLRVRESLVRERNTQPRSRAAPTRASSSGDAAW